MKRALNVLSVAVMIVMTVAFVAVFGTEAYAASSNGMINAGADVLKNGTNTKDAQLVHMGDRYWYVIGYDKEGVAAGSGEMSLLSKESIKSTPFDKNYKTVYNSSNLKNDIEAYINEKFSDGEKSAIAARELPAVTLKQTGNYDWWENNYHTIDAVMDEPVHGALLWPLSAKEAGALNGDIRKTGSDYWLRSLGVPEYEEWVWYGLEEFDVYTTPAAMAIVNAGGNVIIQGEKENTTWWKDMRPAFKLKKGDVILTTAPNGKLSGDDGTLTPCQESSYSDNKWKLTLRDESRNSFHVDPCNVEFGEEGSLTVNYVNASTGENEYISAVIKGADGSIKQYGRIAKVISENGTATIKGLPTDASGKISLPEGDKLYVFNEQYNGDEKTDLASNLTEISLTGHNWVFDDIKYDTRTGAIEVSYHCSIDGNHFITIEKGEYTTERTEPTCEEPGKEYQVVSISAEDSLDGKEHKKSKYITDYTPALDHMYNHYFGFRWTGDATSGYKKAEAIFACDHNYSHKTYVEGVVTEKVQEPTCTAIGRTLYQATLSADKSLDGRDHGEAKYAKARPRLGHDWGEPTYQWSDDNKTVTATRVCKREPSHVETETVETEATNITIAPTCTNTGTGDIKTKPFSNEAFQEQTKTNAVIPVDSDAHVWKEVGRQENPNECGGYVTTFKCTLCEEAEKEEIIGGNAHDWTDYIVDVEPTCTEMGEKSRHCNNCQAHDLDGIETIDPNGHDWEFKDFTWTGDDTNGYEAVANYECKTDNRHKMTVNAEITEKVIDPTCKEKGKTVYKASISAADSLDGTAHDDSKEGNETDTVSHEWKYDSIVWPGSETEDYTEAYAKYTCEYGCEETAKVEAQITEKETEADCDSAGKVLYTATVTADNSLTGVEHKDTQEVKTAEALGHDWEFKDFIWTGDEKKGYTKVLAKYGCKRDPEHEGLFEAKISEDVVEPTCTEKGCTVYVAEVGSNDSLDGNEYVDYKTAKNVSPAHKWGPWKITRKATSRAAGEMTRTCTVCKKKEADKLLLVAKGIAKSKTKATFSWNKVKTADRYVVYLAKCSYKGKSYKYKKIKTVSGKTLKLTKKKLKKNTAYKFYVVAQKKMGGKYTTIAKSKGAHFFTGNVRGKLTNPKAIKLSKSALTIKKGKSAKIKASVTKVKKSKKLATGHAVKLRYISNDPRIATVSAKGKVTAKKKGTCIIYVQAANGIWKTCKVTVR